MNRQAWIKLAQLLIVAMLSMIAGLSFSLALGARTTLLPVVVGAMGAVFISSFLHERNASVLLVGFMSLAGLLITMLAFASFDPTILVEGFVNGWIRLLTSGVPAPVEADLVVVPLIVTWLAASTSAELLRTPSAIAPIGPPIAAYTLGLMFGVDGSAAQQGVGAVLGILVLSGVLMMLRASYRVGGRASGVTVNTSNRRVAAGFGIIAVFALLGTYVGVVLPLGTLRQPFELRDTVREPAQLRTALNPAAFVQRALDDRDDPDSRPVFTVETDRDTEKSRYRLVVLDRYDGKVWSSSAEFLRASTRLPASSEVTVPTATVRQKITVDALSGYWVPMVDRPTRVVDTDLVFDRTSGMLAAPTGLTPGRSFEIESQEPQLSGNANLPRTARFATGPAAQPYLELPPQFTATLRAAASDGARAAFQFQSAAALEKYLSEDRGLETAPPDRPRSGLSVADLDNLLTGTGGGIGSPDQFAALYAILGRAVGMPTRLVVGYGVTPGAGRHVVRTNDLQVWPEVLFDGIGWVAFDPVPGGQAKPDQKPPEDKPGLEDTLKDAAAPPSNAGDVGPPARPAPTPATSGDGGLLRTVTIILVVTVACLGFWVLGLGAVRLGRRRARRRESDPRRLVIGAWDETLDLLADGGLADSRAMTASDVVREGVQRLGPEVSQPLGSLRTIVNQARYRATAPTSQQVQEAWDLFGEFDRRWRKTRTLGDRARLLVDPRPLLARR